MATTMKKIASKAAKFESKKSLTGAMKFLKGNEGTHVMPNGKVMKNSEHKITKK